MFDLEVQLERWRQEAGATLAFEPEELEELEDHLRLRFEAVRQREMSPEEAWSQALRQLGPAHSLALEFAKSKLMPALLHLVRTWGKAGLLLLVLVAGDSALTWGVLDPKPLLPTLACWGLTWLAFVLLLVLLPGKAGKNGVLLGTGLGFCLLPFLHVSVYNRWTEAFVGAGWTHMAASFGWLPLGLGLVGLIGFATWLGKRLRHQPGFPGMLSTALVLIFLLALAPFCSEVIGNLSVRDFYNMPTVQEIHLTGENLNHFITWKFVDVLINCILIIARWLPPVLTLLVSLGILARQGLLPMGTTESPLSTLSFPSPRDFPWIMALAASGLAWIANSLFLPAFNRQILEAEAGGFHAVTTHGGVIFMVLMPTFLFLACFHELTRRLSQARGIRLFYAALIVAIALVPLPLVILLRIDSGSGAVPVEPVWLFWSIITVVLFLAFRQVKLLRLHARRKTCETSLWKYHGGDLVGLGLRFGLNLACCGILLWLVATILAFESTSVIHAMIAWGQSVSEPLTHHYHPTDYLNVDADGPYPLPHRMIWLVCGLTYVVTCLAIGLAVAMALSGLEFIRFNGFRFYRVRQAQRATEMGIPAIND